MAYRFARDRVPRICGVLAIINHYHLDIKRTQHSILLTWE